MNENFLRTLELIALVGLLSLAVKAGLDRDYWLLAVMGGAVIVYSLGKEKARP